MDRARVARQLLRSLCSNTVDDLPVVAQNYRSTRPDVVEFAGIEQKLFERIRESYNTFGPPSTQQLIDAAEYENDTSLKIYIKEVETESVLLTSSYQSRLQFYAELVAGQEISNALLDVSQILKDGRQTKVAGKIEVVRGARAAIDHGITELTRVKGRLDPSQRALGVREAVSRLRQQYTERQAQPVLSYGLATGLTPIDEPTKGGQNKEFWVIAGAPSHGKSTFLINWARHLVYEGKFNVLYFSLEMDKEQVWRIMACGHACHPQFNRPLEYEKIKSGTLEIEDASFYLNTVLPDLENSSGHLEIHHPHGPTTIDDIRAYAEVTNRDHPLDAIFIDYLAIMASPRGFRMSRQERINENILRAKQLATEFDNGYGVFVCSPHQISRKGLARAKENGGIYDTEAIADTSEIERTADVLFTVYQDDVMKQKREALITHLKSRDSRIVDPFNVYCPTEYRFVAELAQVDENQLVKTLTF